jgi:nitrogen-specific signal transduction histidine kinase
METDPPHQDADELSSQLDNLKSGIREIAHEINNPLGIIRMAIYFLQTTNPVGEKREHYFKVIEEGLGRIEQSLQNLKALREGPSTGVHLPPSESDS